MAFLTTVGNAILDQYLRNTVDTPSTSLWLSLHTADPGQVGASETTTVRQAITFDAASSKVALNSAEINFTSMPATTISYVGLWGALTSGTFWWGGTMTPNKAVGEGDTLQIAAGALSVTLT